MGHHIGARDTILNLCAQLGLLLAVASDIGLLALSIADGLRYHDLRAALGGWWLIVNDGEVDPDICYYPTQWR
jgi:hypothetical protein